LREASEAFASLANVKDEPRRGAAPTLALAAGWASLAGSSEMKAARAAACRGDIEPMKALFISHGLKWDERPFDHRNIEKRII